MNVIFDLGNVLIRWDLFAGFDDHFDTPDAMHAYLDEVGFAGWNLEQDGGRSWADGTAALTARLGDRAHPATLYPDRHERTIRAPIEGSWTLVDRLAAAGHGLYALTNWAAELFPQARALHPRLAVFRDIVVSGNEGMAKPDAAIFGVLLERNGLAPEDCVFVDDTAANVDAAAALGMDAIRFEDPEQLEAALIARGLIAPGPAPDRSASRRTAVFAAIDAANAADPRSEDGQPVELLYGRRMTAEQERLVPEASDALAIACRGQHIERWLLPRSDYPEGREGYLAWRRDQGRRHADRVMGLMREAGYDASAVEAAGRMLRKEGIKRDPEVQALEDVACFTFVRHYLGDFATTQDPDALIRIVARTARKMSPAARARALAEFPMPEPLAEAVRAADAEGAGR